MPDIEIEYVDLLPDESEALISLLRQFVGHDSLEHAYVIEQNSGSTSSRQPYSFALPSEAAARLQAGIRWLAFSDKLTVRSH